MSRNLSEGNINKDVASTEFGVRQLFRRPAPPTGAGEMPWARMSRGYDASAQVIPNNSIQTITPNHTYNMGTGESGEDYFLLVGLTSNHLRLLVKGVYAVAIEFIWVEATNFDNVIGVSDLTAGAQHYFAGAKNGATTISQAATFIHNYPANTELALVVLQSAGSNRSVDAAFLQATYLGTYTGTEWTSMDPDQ